MNVINALNRCLPELQEGKKIKIGNYTYWLQYAPQPPDGRYDYNDGTIYRLSEDGIILGSIAGTQHAILAGGTIYHTNNLVRYRTISGMTQRELADKSGVNVRQIQMYESGQTLIANMTAKNAVAIAKALNITAEELLN